MTRSLIAIAIATATVLAASGAAQANSYTVGNLTSLGNYGYSQSSSFAAGLITDSYTFQLTGGDNSFNTIASKLSLKFDQVITFASGQLSGPGAFSQALTPWVNSAGPFSVNGIGYEGILAQGQYTLALSGVAQHEGNYSISMLAAPIPEPETLALLLAGLGLVGTMVRRRTNRSGYSAQA